MRLATASWFEKSIRRHSKKQTRACKSVFFTHLDRQLYRGTDGRERRAWHMRLKPSAADAVATAEHESACGRLTALAACRMLLRRGACLSVSSRSPVGLVAARQPPKRAALQSTLRAGDRRWASALPAPLARAAVVRCRLDGAADSVAPR